MSFNIEHHVRAIRSLLGRRSKACLLAAVSVVASLCGHMAAAQDYLLGPQDVLRIRVFEWRPSTGAPFEWVPLTGEFVISAAGNLSLPIIGTVPAAGKTLEQVSESIGERLQNQVGLQKRPNASVEIASYRPFFVTGLVATPGKYSFSPGLTVVQAVSMAGGIGPVDSNLITLQRDALSGRGEIRALEAERLELVARQARIDAILNNDPEIKFPAELTSRKAEPGVARMLTEEQALFETRLRSMETEIGSLNQAKVLAANQISALKEKAVSLAKQIDMANKDLGSVNKLVQQGLTVSARQLGANQNLADLESRNLDVSLAILKTQQDLAKVDQDIGDVRNRYRINALTEAAELRDRFASNAKKTETASDLLRNLEVRAPAAVAALEEDKDTYSFTTSINRVVDGSNESLIVSDNDPVLPGDVIRVERRQRGAQASVADSN
ncbi:MULTISPECIES: polysaccharide biosynthesis/export family protein [unclassified Rhizobium]|uniref:polysaccharide biosynthesis/export family protein n=1 Tax=unclassified Rhizobium TaxID=2613769 RepID=UPI001613E15E|nr:MULTISPECIES: polysaccharide biosynthesis/export family protein [unclassified Rhizobium]MBB3318310.1 polysaccharide export outer membrane protein [Rhizobium sp. BK181]MCS3742184.1 polysaccharide export outer membrane protein [Rhizobium sp. BK661]MCS4094111.1 polysaccharide export outer membrane protein [Rhizobium sp. BK176]